MCYSEVQLFQSLEYQLHQSQKMADMYREQVIQLEDELSRIREEGDVTREVFHVGVGQSDIFCDEHDVDAYPPLLLIVSAKSYCCLHINRLYFYFIDLFYSVSLSLSLSLIWL